MVRPVTWSVRSLNDLDRITAYIEEFNLAASIRVRDKLVAAAISLDESPERGRPKGKAHELAIVTPILSATGYIPTMCSS